MTGPINWILRKVSANLAWPYLDRPGRIAILEAYRTRGDPLEAALGAEYQGA